MLSNAKKLNQEQNVTALANTLQRFVHPFSNEHDDIINIVTKAIMSDTVQEDIMKRNEKGQQLINEFVSDRITNSRVNIWVPMKKLNLRTGHQVQFQPK